MPTYPKGVISLSFAAIAAVLPRKYSIHFVDLNIEDFNGGQISHFKKGSCLFVGFKVSLQNHHIAIEVTKKLKELNSDLKIVFGGEYPSLLPQEAMKYADTVVKGSFESITDELIKDFEIEKPKRMYDGKKSYNCTFLKSPDYRIIKSPDAYSKVMGYPMETSRGCDKKCTFCMVHTMQPIYNYKSAQQIKREVKAIPGKFINIVDYNIGANKPHLEMVANIFAKSNIEGWMAEMCLETLDDDVLLEKLALSRCKIIYCGLESISQESLLSINKARTNNIYNYRRIVKKAQEYGIQIAGGIIIGLQDSDKNSIDNTFNFFQEVGIIYAKITFLTYSPGTKVYESMKRTGDYLTNQVKHFDGNHFTFLPNGVNKQEITDAMINKIKWFYNKKNISKRAKNAGLEGVAKQEFILFNLYYREVYNKWIMYDILNKPEGFEEILRSRYKKNKTVVDIESSLIKVRSKLHEGK